MKVCHFIGIAPANMVLEMTETVVKHHKMVKAVYTRKDISLALIG
ncbi:MAG TPA: hypothetical protein VNM69_04490 [Bacillus sp. (in: firmicutes)]|nr:hypothetical protein [Bacillus litorisediminis]HWO75163.1 hypothetical protein [Bacillus sp. (in: firmicutes)]